MNSKALLKGLIGTGVAAFVFGGAMLASSGSADATSRYTIGSPVLDDDHASSIKDSSEWGSKDLTCPSNSYVTKFYVYGGTWGTYASMPFIRITCKSATDGSTLTRSAGFEYESGHTYSEMVFSEDWADCNSDGGVLTGLKVGYDKYIKGFDLRCGEINTSGSGKSVTNTGFKGDYLLDNIQADDEETNLICNDSTRVVSGIRLRYKSDNDEIAPTRVQLYCSVVTIN